MSLSRILGSIWPAVNISSNSSRSGCMQKAQARFVTRSRSTIQSAQKMLSHKPYRSNTGANSMRRVSRISRTVKDLRKAAGDVAHGRFASPETISHRTMTCSTCPHLRKSMNQCTKCGCFMKLKTKLSSSTCPIGKW